MVIQGYAARFNSLSENLGGFREQLAPGCFTETLRRDDVVLLNGHDSNQPLARMSAGNLELIEDGEGLYFRATLPDTTGGKDLHGLVRSRVLKSMSFGFSVTGADDESWHEEASGQIVRTVHKLRLLEVSPVTWPAYQSSTVSARSLEAKAKTSTKPATTPYKAAAAARMRKKLIERGHARLAR